MSRPVLGMVDVPVVAGRRGNVNRTGILEGRCQLGQGRREKASEEWG
jgi:hypothetical protein